MSPTRRPWSYWWWCIVKISEVCTCLNPASNNYWVMERQSVQLLSHVQPFATPWTAARQASRSFTIFQCLLTLISIESVMPSNHLVLCCPLLPSIFPSVRVFSSESALHIWWPKDWSFSLSISPSDDYLGLISFRIDWFDLL